MSYLAIVVVESCYVTSRLWRSRGERQKVSGTRHNCQKLHLLFSSHFPLMLKNLSTAPAFTRKHSYWAGVTSERAFTGIFLCLRDGWMIQTLLIHGLCLQIKVHESKYSLDTSYLSISVELCYSGAWFILNTLWGWDMVSQCF